MTQFDLAALGCEDCPANIAPGYVDDVLTVVVTHARTCPWLERVAGGVSRLETPLGVLVHCRAAEVRSS